ncbi:hypothetical protein BC936DRAFT_138625 [Jimgerdemannia flammicorona]|uniref:Uncharacterized protein n=1 Tax=Jimgerdemannia flammicorona TaxID=994334 RepID=A0A433BXE5_9FUNG|nr:hypothetical protein BC936DRAFT_138625 [Jimgerdemannia flammicorona]
MCAGPRNRVSSPPSLLCDIDLPAVARQSHQVPRHAKDLKHAGVGLDGQIEKRQSAPEGREVA